MKKKGRGWIFWTPRILSIVFIAFLSLFSLDVFGEGLGFWQVLGAFLMHNIPVFVLIALLLIAWKHDLVGAIAFILAGLLYISLLAMNAVKGQFEWYMVAWSLQIAGPAIFIGILYFIGWKRKRKGKRRK